MAGVGSARSRSRRRLVLALWLGTGIALVAVVLRWGPEIDGPTPAGEEADRLQEERDRWTVWSEAEEQWRTMEQVEELIILLTPEMDRLAESVLNLELPGQGTRHLFGPQVELIDLAPGGTRQVVRDLPQLSIQRLRWPVSARRRATPDELDLWRPLLDGVLYFEHASFSISSGQFEDLSASRFRTQIRFAGQARMLSGKLVSISAVQRVLWTNQALDQKGDEADWRISEWATEDFALLAGTAPLFEEVLASSLGDLKELARARDSAHERYVVQFIQDPDNFEPPNPFFTVPAEDFHPGLAVVDLDRDGFDDFYVLTRWGPNLFFRNRGDGSFEEIAAEIGLDITDHSSSAIFADFDNDGDADLVLGRTLARSMYLVNEEGRFADRTRELVKGPLPYLTSSVSVVDYDGDGLLDIYFSTYNKTLMKRELLSGKAARSRTILAEYLPQADAQRLFELVAAPDFQQYLNHPGPPNVLLRNLGGGRFKSVHDVAALRIFRNSFQSTWSDYDGDGDPDVYVANDFGPNNLVRNDGGGRFTDVTGETQTADIGFGMGASWGDYDNDGRLDLYVSNMYSTAGNRILRKLDHVDGSFLGAARGNTLFRNKVDGFEKVSGLEAPALMVEKAGWSWAGQFADLDNDGHQDIYALSGYYTAHPKVAIARDT